ncbi:LysR family pca operon transcriptional activator [Pacificibacter maritimus]|uniref:LysR family pca operon transcriptional activator n=1 Tax=Pacificibacter maritimus TaxID=762213 RepID=A0A3N4UZK5_9RHOB|nr:LysR substrate-binding domain-containing protein [Pacificibacter maritimus]RPE67020.1 LysR family pca operon transcriptional activator [Pacificibacter maritimus]
MIDHRIRFRHLHCFLETARLGSLSVAAQALNVSQPAASKSIKELETLLGVALFDRTGRRLVLTSAGRRFQQHAGAALVDLGRAQDMVREMPRQKTKLVVGALPTAATDLLPRASLQFQHARPNCLIRVSTGPNWMLLSQLREGILDMVVGRMTQSGTMDGLSFRQLYSERVVPVVRPGHPLDRADWSASALRDFPLMLPPSGAVISPMVRAYLFNNNISAHEPAFENVSLAFGRHVVQNSDVVWFISQGVVRSDLAAGTLKDLPLQDVMLGGPVGVSMRDGAMITPEQRHLLECLVVAAEALPR